MTNYVSKKDLLKEIQAFVATGVVTDRFNAIIMEMAKGIQQRYGRGIDLGDFSQNCWLIVITKSKGIDLTKNVFSYLTTCFLNELRRMYRGRGEDLRDPTTFDFEKGVRPVDIQSGRKHPKK